MANSFDATARLAEGRPAVDDVAEYVLACHRLGYQHQDLTAHAGQVRDWYDSEDGLDLHALDADCAALAAAAAAAEDAARTHTDLVAELTGAWSGRGATAGREFAWRSAQAAGGVSASLRGAADALATLRDELWRAVDAKVAAVQAIDGRHRGERGEWLAASRAVTTGGGDLASASELVDHQVKPFVANDVGSDWIGAMRTAIASIGAAYDAAIASASSGAPAVFDVPGALGPRATSAGRPESVAATTPAAAAASAPVTAAMPAAATTAWASPAPATAPLPVDPTASGPFPSPALPAAGTALPAAGTALPAAGTPTPPMGDLGGAAPALGTGVSGFGQQLADLIGGLIGSTGGNGDLAGADDSVDGLDDPPLDDPAAGDEADPDTEKEPSPDGEPDAGEAVEPGREAIEEASPEPPPPEPTAVPPPPPPDQLPAAPDSIAEPLGPTLCEIAADELPQVGE